MDIKSLYQKFIASNYEISTDTRYIIPGSLFFAWKGEHFDGNSFAEKALELGCSYAVVDNLEYAKNEKYIYVENSIETLGHLARYHRMQYNIPILALTGSNGKTTTKELIAAVLGTQKKIIATLGNLNNHVGVPKTLLKIRSDTQIAVIEMGANHPGEIEHLCNIAMPTHGLITNIGRAHLGLFGGFAGVVAAKTELYEYIRKHDGELFVNSSDTLLREKSKGIRSIMYGSEFHADPVFSKKTLPYMSVSWSHETIQTQLTGEYNLDNIAAAISVAVYFEVFKKNIIKGITDYSPKNERSEIVETLHGNMLIKDYYNANRSSMEKALENLGNINSSKPKIAILGDMFELGEFSISEHTAVMHYAASMDIKKIYLVGETFSSLIHEYHHVVQYKTLDEVLVALKKNTPRSTIILIKSSQGMKFKRVFDEIDW